MQENKNMNLEEFTEVVVERIKDYLPDAYKEAQVMIRKVWKNNVELSGLLVYKEDDGAAVPTLYLEYFHEKMINEDLSLDEILKEMAEARVENANVIPFDPNDLTKFDVIRDKIFPIVVNGNDNGFIQGKPHKMIEDMAVLYRIEIPDSDCRYGATVSNDLFKHWKVSLDELHELAIANLKKKNPVVSPMPFNDELFSEQLNSSNNEEEIEELTQYQMVVITNQDSYNGASVFLDSGVMEAVRDILGDKFYVIPSSVHEMVCFPEIEGRDKEKEIKNLHEMVRFVNESIVHEMDILSDSVYVYDFESHVLKAV